MAEFNRTADVIWQGNREGHGQITTSSGILKDAVYSFPSRFGQEAGTNPEELLVAAHAACFTQFMIARMTAANFIVKQIKTQGTCTLTTYPSGHPKVTKIKLVTEAQIENMDEARFQEFVTESKENCPISGALKVGDVEVEAKLVQPVTNN